MKRTTGFQRNQKLEQLLKQLNDLLEPAEAAVRNQYRLPQLPILLVVGPPRSGTTLMLQWLAQTGQFAYPTNLLSRFFRAPYVGALINQLIGDPDYNFNNELWDHSTDRIQFDSNLGKTRGMFEPNEFWYFWRRFIPNDQAQWLDEQQLESVDAPGFLAGLASLQAVYQKPWAMKGIILQYNLEFLNKLLESVLFIHTRRDVADNAHSLLKARKAYFGDTSEWFSVRPPGSESLLKLNPAEQVVGQVVLTNQSIERELARIPADRQLVVDYVEFCKNPGDTYQKIRDKLSAQGTDISADYVGAESFDASAYEMPTEARDELNRAIATIQKRWPTGESIAAAGIENRIERQS